MKPKEILENNKIVAEFMGDSLCLSAYGTNWKAILEAQGHSGYPPYHKSYDWLMPVVEEIEKTEFWTSLLTFMPVHFNVYIKGCLCQITADYDTEKQLEKIGCYGMTKIDAIYQTVVKFVMWYNENQRRS